MSDLMRAEYFEWFSRNSTKLDAQADQYDGRAIAIRDMGFCIWKASRNTQEIEDLRKDAGRYRWLNSQRSKVWREIADIPLNKTDEFIDEAIHAAGVKTK